MIPSNTMDCTERRIHIAEMRAELLRCIRNFFHRKGYLEVDTPLLIPFRIPEAPIRLFSTLFDSSFHQEKALALEPSPEIWMKRLLSEGFPSCFQICKSFRNGEQLAHQHNPEFTMLEWYTRGADYNHSAATMEELLHATGEIASSELFRKEFVRRSMHELFMEYTGIDLDRCGTLPELKEDARRAGLEGKGDTWEELFHKLFLTHVEPRFTAFPVLFVYDYPEQLHCLAKKRKDAPCRERWELYVRGIEIANCFSEETDPAEVQAFMEGQIREARAGEIPPDRELPGISGRMPPSSGVALGVDRLLMSLMGISDIREVLLFPFSSF